MIKTVIATVLLCATASLATSSTVAWAQTYPHAAEHATGNDVSYPQCNRSLPAAQAFTIVGMNNGSASNYNPCVTKELAWASTSTGSGSQPKVAVYANTGNPGDVTPKVADWPTTSAQLIDPYGMCTGENNAACSWEYGYQRAYADVATSPQASQIWWMDVETSNSWSANLASNRADLEGMTYAFTIAGSRVGIYSTPTWWSKIAGDVPTTSTLYDLQEWRTGSQSANQAKSDCKLAPLTPGGHIEIDQYSAGSLDNDLSCP